MLHAGWFTCKTSFGFHNNAARKLLHFIDERSETGRCSVTCSGSSAQVRIWPWTTGFKPALLPLHHVSSLEWTSSTQITAFTQSLLISPVLQGTDSLQERGGGTRGVGYLSPDLKCCRFRAHKCPPHWAEGFSGPDQTRKRNQALGSRVIYVNPIPAEAPGLGKIHSAFTYLSCFLFDLYPELKSTTHFQE